MDELHANKRKKALYYTEQNKTKDLTRSRSLKNAAIISEKIYKNRIEKKL